MKIGLGPSDGNDEEVVFVVGVLLERGSNGISFVVKFGRKWQRWAVRLFSLMSLDMSEIHCSKLFDALHNGLHNVPFGLHSLVGILLTSFLCFGTADDLHQALVVAVNNKVAVLPTSISFRGIK
jgi:hypothetical protein